MNFILYEDNARLRELYKKVIFSFIGSSNCSFKVIELDSYTKDSRNLLCSIDGAKIYILDIEVPGKTGIDLAREIRNSGDWQSPIIIITSHMEFKTVNFTSKLLMLDFILKNENIEIRLKETLRLAYGIITKHKCLTFCSNSELYKIPYDDILYIEKNINNNDSFIVTKKSDYLIKDTINNLEKKLKDDPRFFKTHRSCIVNLFNIDNVNFNSGVIFFTNHQIDLLARDKKKKLKEVLMK